MKPKKCISPGVYKVVAMKIKRDGEIFLQFIICEGEFKGEVIGEKRIGYEYDNKIWKLEGEEST